MMHLALHGASRQMWTVRGTATKSGVRSEMIARISFPKYGNPRTTFRGKDESFMEIDTGFYFARPYSRCMSRTLM